MSISSSLYTAESALDAAGVAMGVVGNNIANTNTVGFKASQVDFADLFAAAQGELQIGDGVQLANVERLHQQGAIETTASVLDLAVVGQGFFILKDAEGHSFYSRAGEFNLDRNGNIVNPDGLALQGTGGNIALSTGMTLPGQATTTVGLALNLDATAAPVSAFPAGPDASPSTWTSASDFSTGFSIFDSSGGKHDATFLFRQNGVNSWEYRVVAKRSEIDSGAPTSTDLREIGSGTLAFDSSGALTGSTGGINAVAWVSGGATAAIAAANLNFAGSTQYAEPSAVLALGQDGAAEGVLKRIAIDAEGKITGEFSNGRDQVLGQVLLANFNNPAGLDAIGDTLLAVSADSGAAVTGVPGQGGRGVLLSGALEASNVDLGQEFVNMILAQRSFQISSRIISVADEMYTVATGLKA
jgi:flagellar hook protein FlgE